MAAVHTDPVHSPARLARAYSTDVYLACQCRECDGREVRVTLRRYRNLCRLPSPGARAGRARAGVDGGGDTKITDR
jgi:hypothetical protein